MKKGGGRIIHIPFTVVPSRPRAWVIRQAPKAPALARHLRYVNHVPKAGEVIRTEHD